MAVLARVCTSSATSNGTSLHLYMASGMSSLADNWKQCASLLEFSRFLVVLLTESKSYTTTVDQRPTSSVSVQPIRFRSFVVQ